MAAQEEDEPRSPDRTVPPSSPPPVKRKYAAHKAAQLQRGAAAAEADNRFHVAQHRVKLPGQHLADLKVGARGVSIASIHASSAEGCIPSMY